MLTRVTIVSACFVLAACGSGAPDEGAAEPPQASSAQETPAVAARGDEQAGGITPAPAPQGAGVYFVEPEDGETVTNPVRVMFGLRGAGVAPAGIEQAATGHHHLLIDTELPPPGRPIPADARHVHFGGGQTETEIMLEPGAHTLQLLFADHLHVPHDPPIASDRVTIHVQ